MRGLVRMAAATVVAAAGVLGVPAVANAAGVTTCTGTLAPGTYGSVVVPAGATCTSDGPIMVNGSIRIGRGATFVLGSEESTDTGTINGSIIATHAAQVQVHFATIKGSVLILGGSGAFGGPEGIFFSTVEDSNIGGSAVINGYDGFWLGFIRNHVGGSAVLNNNVLPDSDANEFVTNVIGGSLICIGNDPPAQVGDSEGSPNVVGGAKVGQCAAV